MKDETRAKEIFLEYIHSHDHFPEGYIDDVGEFVWSLHSSEMMLKNLTEAITDHFPHLSEIAYDIAMDYSSKAANAKTRAKCEKLGFQQFIWMTLKDELVRPEHRKNEGKVFSWKDGDNGDFPGKSFKCRCFAVSNIK